MVIIGEVAGCGSGDLRFVLSLDISRIWGGDGDHQCQ